METLPQEDGMYGYWCTIPQYGDMRGVARIIRDRGQMHVNVVVSSKWFTPEYLEAVKPIGDDSKVVEWFLKAADALPITLYEPIRTFEMTSESANTETMFCSIHKIWVDGMVVAEYKEQFPKH